LPMTAERLSSNPRLVFLASLAIFALLIFAAILTASAAAGSDGISYGAGFTGEVDNQPVYVHGAPHPRIYLYAGESVLKEVSGLKRVAVGESKIADVAVIENDTLLINGVSPGYTTLIIWDDTGMSKLDLVVTAQPPVDLSLVQRLLEPWDVQLNWWKERLVIQGTVDSEAEKERVENIVSSLWDPVVSLLVVQPEQTAEKTGENAQSWDVSADILRAQEIQKALGVPSINVQVVKDLAILEGTAATAAESLRAVEIARQFSPEVLNLIEVEEGKGEPSEASDTDSPAEDRGESQSSQWDGTLWVDREAAIEDIKNLCAAWGYTLSPLGDVFILEGEIQDLRRKDVLLALLAAHGLAFVDATSSRPREVVPEELAQIEDMLQELPGLKDVKLSRKGRRLILEGWAEDPAVADVAESLARDYGAPLGLEVSSLIQLHSIEPGKLPPSAIQREIGIPGLTVRWVGDALVLEGTLDPKAHQAAVALASQYSSQVVDLISSGVPTSPTAAQINDLIGSDSVTASVVGEAIVLKGTAVSVKEKEAVLALASVFGYPVIDGVVVREEEPRDPTISEADVDRAIALDSVRVRLLNGTIVLDGTVKSDADRVRAERIAETFGMQVVSLIEVAEPADEAVGALELDKTHRWEELVAEAAALGATLYTVASTPILAGQVTPEAASYLEALLNSELSSWINRLEILHPPPSLPSLEEISSLLASAEVECTYVGDTLVLQGLVRSPEEQRRIEAIASMFGVPVESFITVVEDVRQVWVDVCMLELSYSDYRELGIDWDVHLSTSEQDMGGRTPSVGFLEDRQEPQTALSVVVGPLWAETYLHSLLRSGKAKVLASPSLLTENRRQAEFLAGGEIPVPGDSEGIEWKSYGVGLKVTPTILDNGTIHLVVEPEVSSLDWDNAVRLENALIPGVRTRRWRTQAAVEPGKTLVIGGLLSEEESVRERQVPILGELPILGGLFRSEVKSSLKTDLVVLVTPRVIETDGGLLGWESKAKN